MPGSLCRWQPHRFVVVQEGMTGRIQLIYNAGNNAYSHQQDLNGIRPVNPTLKLPFP